MIAHTKSVHVKAQISWPNSVASSWQINTDGNTMDVHQVTLRKTLEIEIFLHLVFMHLIQLNVSFKVTGKSEKLIYYQGDI